MTVVLAFAVVPVSYHGADRGGDDGADRSGSPRAMGPKPRQRTACASKVAYGRALLLGIERLIYKLSIRGLQPVCRRIRDEAFRFRLIG